MAVAQRHETHDPPTPESIWALLRETARRHEEIARRQEETDRIVRETSEQVRKTSEQMEKTEKILGGLGDSIGRLIETLIGARLWEKFAAYPYNLRRAYRRVEVYGDDDRILTDIDILLSDTEWAMAVEVKRRVKDKDVERHEKRMERIRKYPPAEVKGKKLLGALAGGEFDPDVREFAHEAGFFVLELRGESVDLVPPPEGFSPGVW